MEKIVKFSGYIIGNDTISKHTIPFMVKEDGNILQHFHYQEAPLQDEEIEEVRKPNCDLALCEKHFPAVPTGDKERKVIVGRYYRHFKFGKLVKVLGVSQDTENPGAYSVVYCCADGKIWHRPYSMFVSEVDREKYPDAKQKYRFELVEDKDNESD